MTDGAGDACPICGLVTHHRSVAEISPFLRERCSISDGASATSHFCDQCEHVFLSPFLTDEQLSAIYDGYRNQYYNSQRLRFEPSYSSVADAFADAESEYFQMRRSFYDDFNADRFSMRGLVVDAGDGEGYFGRYAYPHADVVSLPRFGKPPGVDLPDLLGAADVLMMSHTLQQSPRPKELLGGLTRWLRAGAEVWLEVPIQYRGSLRGSFTTQKALADRGVRPLGVLATLHENLSHYSVSSLRRICARAGLEPIEFMRSSIGVLAVLTRRSANRVELTDSLV